MVKFCERLNLDGYEAMLIELWLELELFFSHSNSASDTSSLLLKCISYIQNGANRIFSFCLQQYLNNIPNFICSKGWIMHQISSREFGIRNPLPFFETLLLIS
uniref:Uncharacterized protein n=1 Tax=Opuntia streptacantha TaxID=393608 RepID=A0A7C8ZJX0_OPUST